MAGPGRPESQSTWRTLLAGHFSTARGRGIEKCPMCGAKDPCDNYFCLKCEVGGVCPATFHGGGDHFQHPWIRVYNVSRELSLREEELTKFMDSAKIQHMQKFLGNKKTSYKFFTPITKGTPKSKSPHRKGSGNYQCQICGHITTSPLATPNYSDTPVCSINCLLDQADRNPENGLVRLVLSAEDATMDPPRVNKDAAIMRLDNNAAVESIDRNAAAESSDNEDHQVEQPRQEQSRAGSGERQQRRKQNKERIFRSDYPAEYRPQP